jgi:hypothetical protein
LTERRGAKCAQVDDLGLDVFLVVQHLGGAGRLVDAAAVANDGDVGAFAEDAGLAELDAEVGVVRTSPLRP